MIYDLDKQLNENSKHMDKLKKKYKNYRFTSDDIIGYD